jgi:hypothetical protein
LIELRILAMLVVGLALGVLVVMKPFTTAILFGAALATAAWPMRSCRKEIQLLKRQHRGDYQQPRLPVPGYSGGFLSRRALPCRSSR